MARDPIASRPATVTVRGEAVVRATPDEALLWITLTTLQNAPGPALADVAARSNGLTSLLDELGIPRADRSSGGITVSEEFDHTKDGRVALGHRASMQASIRVSDPDMISRLITRATEDLAGQIDGPRWQIALTNPARLAAATQAAADGKRRAQAYAEGVEAKLGRLLELNESDRQPRMLRLAAMKARRSAPDPMPVEPGEHEVAASIELTFELELTDPPAA